MHNSETSVWERQRQWFMPAPHRLLAQHSSTAGERASRFHCQLAYAGHSYLQQHRVSGRSILPGSAMFEAGFAAAALLLPEAQQGQLGLQAAAIASPLLLQPLASSGASQLLLGSVDRQSGEVQLSSRHAVGRAGRGTVHMAAAAGIMNQQAYLVSQQAQAPPAYAPLLLALHRSTTPAGAWQGQTLGSLCQQTLQPAADSYHCHPALVDAATHVGAAFDTEHGSAPRVPVSLGSYCLVPPRQSASSSIRGCSSGSRCKEEQQLFATAAAAIVQQDGSRLSSFAIAGRLSLAQLQSRPLGSRPASAAEPAKGSLQRALAADCYSYEIEWQAATVLQPAAKVASASPAAPAVVLESNGATAASAAAPSLLQTALCSYTAALRMLQRLRAGSSERLTATVHGVACQQGAPLAASNGSSNGLASVGAAAVGGLLRVAALEEPAWQLQLQHADSSAACPAAAASLLEADAHGGAAAASISRLPALQLAASQPGVDAAAARPAAMQQRAQSGQCHVISGGMGGLGLLAACHLAQQAQRGGRLLLLARKGSLASSNLQSQQLLQSASYVILQQADVAAAGDAKAVAQQLRCPGLSAPATSYIHAAGVLADSMLPSQRLSGARAVFAPKLGGMAAVLPHLQQHALLQLVLFSSMSALLGNRGQANYAAANAALDASVAALCCYGQSSASVQWGAWAGSGMATTALPQLLARLQKTGRQSRGAAWRCCNTFNCM